MKANWIITCLFSVMVAPSVFAAENPEPGVPKGGRHTKADPAGPRPKIHCDTPLHTFGQVWNHQSVEHEFVVRNAGQAPLQIRRVRSSCSCMLAQFTPHAVNPGATTRIKINLNTKNLKGKSRYSVFVESNDPGRRHYTLSCEGEVRGSIAMDPPVARFKGIERKKRSTLELVLTNNTDVPMTFSDPRSTAPNVSATIAEVEKGKKCRVILTARPPYPNTTLQGSVTLKTGLKMLPTYKFKFRGELPPAVEIQPERVINLGDIEREKEYTRTVRIVSKDDTEFEISEVTSTNWRITPAVHEVKPRSAYRVDITLHPPYEWGINRGYLRFKLRGPNLPQLTLQVYGRLPRPISITPVSLLFRNLRTDRGGTATVTLKVEDGSKAKITAARSTIDRIRAKIETVVDGKEYTLTAMAEPPLGPGRLAGEIVLETTHPRIRTLKVPVQSFPIPVPLPAISVIPDPVLIVPRAEMTGKTITSLIIVRANNNEKVHVTRVEVSQKRITAQIERQKGADGKTTLVRLTIPPDVELRPEGETVTIYTDHKSFPMVTRKIVRAGTDDARVRRPSDGRDVRTKP